MNGMIAQQTSPSFQCICFLRCRLAFTYRAAPSFTGSLTGWTHHLLGSLLGSLLGGPITYWVAYWVDLSFKWAGPSLCILRPTRDPIPRICGLPLASFKKQEANARLS